MSLRRLSEAGNAVGKSTLPTLSVHVKSQTSRCSARLPPVSIPYTTTILRFVSTREPSRWAQRPFLAKRQTPPLHILDPPKSAASVGSRWDALTVQLREAISAGSIRQIHRTYSRFLDGFTRGSSSNVSISSETRTIITSSLLLLAKFANAENLELIERLLECMHTDWGIPVDSELHSRILDGIRLSGKETSRFNWLLRMKTKAGGCSPTLDQWHSFLSDCISGGQPGQVVPYIAAMRPSGCPPTIGTFELIFSLLSQIGHHNPKAVRKLLGSMKEEGIPPTEPIVLYIADNYPQTRIDAGFAAVWEAYKLLSDNSNEDPRHKRLAITIAGEHGGSRATELLARYQQEGFQPSMRTLDVIVETTASLKVLCFWERQLGITADSSVWASLIRAQAAKGDSEQAVSSYRKARKEGIPQTVAMLHPVLRSLCTGSLGPPTEKKIDEAVQLHREFVGSRQHAGETRRGPRQKSEAPLYNTLLRTLTMSPNKDKYGPVAVSLLEEMRSREISMDRMTTTSTIILLMRSTSNHEEALDAYKRAHKTPDGGFALDQEGYVAVLNAFVKQLTDSGVPSPHLYFEIVKDMAAAGYEISVEVYTIILGQIAKLATLTAPDDVDTRTALLASLRRTHDFLTVDASVKPDTAIWNQLMDAYQRTGSFGDAYRIWETLTISGQADNASVSIILDACGFAGAHDVAVRIFSKLEADGFPLNRRNWMSWLECLCRSGRLDHAVKVLCLEMSTKGASAAPNADDVRLLLKFAAKANQESLVRLRIKHYLPELWTSLPDDLRHEQRRPAM